MRPVNLVDMLRERAQAQPEERAFSFLADGIHATAHLSWSELDARARSVGAWLREAGMQGQRALLIHPPGLDFVAAFLGCLYGGVVAVPAYPPGSRRTLPRLRAIVRDSEAVLALTCASELERLEALASRMPELATLRWLATDNLPAELAGGWQAFSPGAEAVAFLQYTSGSTATPKGVQVTHGNLAHNEEMIRRAFDQSEASVIVGWLPLYHDMGLIGNVLQPLWAGARCVLMPPLAFLRQPLRWLRAISDYRATTSGGPNFAYDLCIDRTLPEERAELDLTSWRVAFNGAEPVRASTLERFADTFASCGFSRQAFYPCYGLAEATLFVSGGEVHAEPAVLPVAPQNLEHGEVVVRSEKGSRELVGSGRPRPEQRLLVVDPESLRPYPESRVGEIWIAGPSVAEGYQGRPETTREVFGARLESGGEDAFLRTGDLGFLHEGELFVTGRLKDLIILRGRNLYPQDVEWTAERSHPALRPGGGAAFSVEIEGEEALVLVHELERRHEAEAALAAEAVRRAVAEEHEARLYEVVLLRVGALPRTSSGKVRRRTCRAAYLVGDLKVVLRSALEAEPVTESIGGGILTRQHLMSLPAARRQEALEEALAGEVGRVTRRARGELEPHRPLTALGLDSLAAVELGHSVESLLEVSLPWAELLSGASLSQLAAQLMDRVGGVEEAAPPALVPGAPSGELTLSAGQQALWFLARLAPSSTAYHLVAGVRVLGSLDVPALGRATSALVARHAALRTSFPLVAGEPCQRVAPAVKDAPASGFSTVDMAGRTEAQINERLQEEAYRPFDLARGPLLRLTVLTGPRTQHRWALAIHHLVADLWSMVVLVRDLGRLYARETGTAGAPLEPLSVTYTDWAHRQREVLAGPRGQELEAWWCRRLEGVPSVLELPTDRPRPTVESFRGARVRRCLGVELTEAVRGLGDGTVFMKLLAIYQLLMRRYSAQPAFLVGAPSAGRQGAETSDVVGYFVNPLALPADLSGAPSGHELLGRVRRTVTEALAHQGYPFPLLAERLQPERDPSRSPLFQVMFAFQKAHGAADEALSAFALGWNGVPLELGSLRLESMTLEERGSAFDLTLMAARWNDGLGLALTYNTDLWDTTTARRLLGHFETLARQLAAAPDVSVDTLPMLGPAERHQLLQSANDTATAFLPACLHHAFEAQVEHTPETLALLFEESGLTYAELDRQANRLAHHLITLGVVPGDRVGVMMDRSLEMVTALLAILKAGGAWVPLDPDLPEERLAFMVGDFSSGRSDALVLTCGTSLPADGTQVLAVDVVGELPCHTQWPAVEVSLDHPAYMIYTSGSTGRPKGVVNSHRGIANRLLWVQQAFTLGAGDRVLQKTPLSFDVSIGELFWPLVTGAQLVLARPGGHRDAAYLARLVRAVGMTTMHFVPSMFQLFLDEPELESLTSVRRIMTSGEALPRALCQRFAERFGRGAELHNLYGPTEAAVEVTWWPCKDWRERGQVPIGRPIGNVLTYVLDPRMAPVPFGVAGELHLGGVQVARGYHGRPGLTTERFVPDPFACGARLYKTGDLVRWLGNGDLEYLGRIDFQVKLRGFRIELGEIEAALVARPGVREAVAVVREGRAGDPRLVAYVVASGAAASSELAKALRPSLAAELPNYMVPSAFVFLDQLPLSPSGKLDRSRLPAPSWQGEEAYTAPRTPLEQHLATLWSEVLGVERVGVHDNFFALGGHSLLATRMASRLRRDLGLELPLRRLFEAPTLSALAEALAALQPMGAAAPVEPVSREGELELSFAQERLWLLHQLEGDSVAYNMPAAVSLSGPLEVPALGAALCEVVHRHEALRTSVAVTSGRPHQAIAAPGELALPLVDLSGVDPEHRRGQISRLTTREARRPFDLKVPPMLRAGLLRRGAHDHVLLVTMHHIASDGWSTGVLVRELGELYTARLRGRAPSLAPLAVQYADYAAWQRAWLTGEVLEEQLQYWRARLEGTPAMLELPTDRSRPQVRDGHGGRLPMQLPASLTKALATFARRSDATLFMTLLAALQALLSRYSHQSEVAVGSPIAGRRRRELEELIGFFVNILVLRGDLAGNPTFPELLARTREITLGAYAHQDLPFERLVEALEPARNEGYSPLFQVMFVLQNEPMIPARLQDLEVEVVQTDAAAVKFDLSLSLTESDEGLAGWIEYARDLFDETRVRRLASHFETLLGGVVAAGEGRVRRLSELPFFGPAERHQLLVGWNDVDLPARPEPCTLRDLFEAWAASAPDALAIRLTPQESGASPRLMSYGELDRRANRVAHALRAWGVVPGAEVRVSLYMERSAATVGSILAVVKAGGVWVPIDPAAPPERTRFMLEDTDAPVVLTQDHLLGSLTGLSSRVVAVDREDWSAWSDENPRGGCGPEHLAYVIYTSGSTGRPKATALGHAGLVNLVSWHQQLYRVSSADRTNLAAGPGFDPTVYEVWAHLTCGASIHIPAPDLVADPRRLLPWLVEQRITCWFMPTPLAEILLGESLKNTPDARLLAMGGDRMRRHPERDLSFVIGNMYGPTENTIVTTSARVPHHSPYPGAAPNIGRPVSRHRVRLLDPRLRPVPLGVVGELCASGVGLARGYLGRAALSAERFVPDPWGSGVGAGVGQRLYRTGDLARYLSDGSIDCLGRIDHQVKVRGVRIELGEIESTLLKHPAVREAVVMLRDGAPHQDHRGEHRLAAFLTIESEATITSQQLRDHLRSRLPEAMVPSAFVVLEVMPMTPNAKVDRAALERQALPETSDSAGSFMAPSNPLEEWLATTWAELLDRERVGIHDDFFELGGHSLLATRLVARVREAWGVEVELRRLFEMPTVAGLAALVADSRDEHTEPAPPLVSARQTRPEEVPLSFAQERLWFLDQLEGGSTAYNLPAAVRLRGRLDAGALTGALAEEIGRHESLRTTFPDLGMGPMQRIAEARRSSYVLPMIDLTGLPAQARRTLPRHLAAEQVRRPFDLARGPLLRAALLRLAADEHMLLLDMHHIVSDGWSMGVLVRELGALYEALSAGRPSPLPPLDLQYADYALWQRRWLTAEVLERQLAYWHERLSGVAVLELATDRPRKALRRRRGAGVTFTLPAALVQDLRRLGHDQGATLFMTLLAAFSTLLSRLSGAWDVAVGAPIANRRRLETESLIGFFVNTLVLRLDLGVPGLSELLRQARDLTLEAHAHQDVPFEKVVEALRPDRQLGRSPLFQVMLAFQNVPVVPLTLPGLELEPLDVFNETAKFDLGLVLTEEEDAGLRGRLGFDRDLFDPTSILRLGHHLEVLLEGVVTALSGATLSETGATRLGELPLLSRCQCHQVLIEWNDDRAYPGGGLLHELFQARWAEMPDAVALCYDRGVEVSGAVRTELLTYSELGTRAGRMARRLRRLGVGPEQVVGVSMERSPEMVACLIAILQAGGAYLPLDPRHPRDRLRFMIDDARVRVLVTDLSGRAFGGTGAMVLEPSELAGAPGEMAPPDPGVTPESPVYVIYTSGSTGRPKGVMIPQRAIVNRLQWIRAHELDTTSRYLQKTTIGFDASVVEIFAPLISGAQGVMAHPDGERDPGYLMRRMREERITQTSFPKALLEVACGDPELSSCRSLKQILVGGERMPEALPERFYARLPEAVLENRYGPTETTVAVTAWRCRPGQPEEVLPIGRPLARAEIYVLDRRFRTLPAGAAGEICVGGPVLARGYLGRPASTAKSFVPDPHPAGSPGARLYRTGDLGRFRGDGAAEFLGRIDQQVKIRGFRVELGEIEAVLHDHPRVRHAAVVDRAEGTSRQLAAYVVTMPGTELPQHALAGYLAEKLPDHMVPAAFVYLETLPMSPTGKVDRAALGRQGLPAPEQARGTARYTAPRGPLEELVAGIWAEVLSAADVIADRKVGVHDDFFALGGHSLLATQVVSRLRRELGLELEVRTLFEASTVAELTSEIATLQRRALGFQLPPIAPARPSTDSGDRDDVPLSCAQQRLWFLDRLRPGSAAYNMPFALRLEGRLDSVALAVSLARIVARHESLRTRFISADGRPVQRISSPSQAPFELPEVDLTVLPAPYRDSEADRLTALAARAPFDLETGPLLRAALLRRNRQDHLLILVMHHIVSDGWSMGVLVRELTALYRAHLDRQLRRAPDVLPALPVQYTDYTLWQRRWGDEMGERLATWWKERLAGAPELLELATDRPRPALQSLRGAVTTRLLAAPLTTQLEELARNRGASLFMTLLAAFAVLLERRSGARDVVVGTQLAQRNRLEIEGLIGFFVNTLALRLRMDTLGSCVLSGGSSRGDFAELLDHAREVTLGAYAHQDLPFEKLVEELAPARCPGHPPIYQVMLTLHNAPMPALDLPGLTARALEVETGAAKLDLSLSVARRESGLGLVLEYCTDLFEERTAERLLDHFKTLLEEAAVAPEKPLTALASLVPAARRQILEPELPVSTDTTPEPATCRAIATVWCQVLELERVGLDEAFFSLGGHSLLAVEAHSRLCRHLDVELELVDLFFHPTVRTLARWVEMKREALASRPRSGSELLGVDTGKVPVAASA